MASMIKRFLKRVDPIARRFGFYTSYTLDKNEYIGEAPYTVPGFLWFLLNKAGYESPPTTLGITLEAAKQHPETGAIHDGSYRKVDPENPRWQYHVHTWGPYGDSPCTTTYEFYSHYELRPDITRLDGESYRDMIHRLQTHYRPEWGESYFVGVACDKLRQLA